MRQAKDGEIHFLLCVCHSCSALHPWASLKIHEKFTWHSDMTEEHSESGPEIFWDQNLSSPYPLTCVYTLRMPYLFWVASLCVTPCQFEHLRKVYWTLGLQLGVASLSSGGRNSSSSTVNSAKGEWQAQLHSYIFRYISLFLHFMLWSQYF